MSITVSPCICHYPRLCQRGHQLDVLSIVLFFLFFPFWFLEQHFNRYFSLIIFFTFFWTSTEIVFFVVVLKQKFKTLNENFMIYLIYCGMMKILFSIFCNNQYIRRDVFTYHMSLIRVWFSHLGLCSYSKKVVGRNGEMSDIGRK